MLACTLFAMTAQAQQTSTATPADKAAAARAGAEQDQQIQQQREVQQREAAVNAPSVRSTREDAPDWPDLPNETPCFRIDTFVFDIPTASPQTVGATAAGTPPLDRFTFAREWVGRYAGACVGKQGLDALVKGLQRVVLSRGYITTRVLLPEQDLASGTLRFALIPGVIHQVRFADPALRGTWKSAFPTRDGELLDLRDLEQGLEQMKRVSNQDVSMQIVPANLPGQSDVVLDVKRTKPWTIVASVDNAGARATGQLQGSLSAGLYNPLGLNDIFNVGGTQDLLFKDHDLGSRGWHGSYAIPWGYWSATLTIVSGKDINVLGSGIALEKGVATLVAAGDVTIGEVTETHEFHSRQEDSSGGFLSSTTTVSTTDTKNAVANGSVISADSVAVAAGKDMSVRGSTIVGTKDVALQAGHDLRIESTENVSESRTFREEKRSGFGSSGGVGISYGNNEQRDRTNDSSVTQTGSLIGSVNGNVSMVAGNDLLVRGSDVVAGGNVTGIGRNVTVESAVNRQHHDETHEMTSSGFTLAVKAPVIDAIQNVANQTRAAADSGGDARVSALRGYAAASGAVGALGQGKGALDALSGGGKPEAKVELSWGSSSSKSTSSSDSTQNVSSNIKAGGTAAFIATGDEASGNGNVNIIGSNVDAKDVLLQANNQVNLSHSTDTESSRSESESTSGSVGVSYGTSGWGVSASFSKSSGDANSDSTFQNNSHVNASNTVVIVSGGDTNIVGGNVNADKVIARVGGDLNIASVQDTSESSAHQQSMGGGVNLSMGGASGSASYARGNASGNYAGVEEQSGIQAGDGGFDVGVMGNTDLKGAYIASTADPSKNQLTTGTLTFSDIENHSEYSANSFGVGGGATVGNGGANERTTGNTSGKNTGGISPMLPQMESGSERATTRTGVSEGTITLTNEANQTQDLASLNRDTADLNGTVTRTPDLQDLLNDQSRLMAAATAAGEAVARDIGTYADRKAQEAEKLADGTNDPALKAQYLQEAKDWSEGGDYRATMHAAGGAIVAGLGGGNALGGALGAGLTSKLGRVLNGLSDEIRDAHPTGNADIDRALGQIVATGVGTAVGAVAGGTSGAFTGFNTDRFNRQLHSDEKQWINDRESAYAKKYGLTPEQARDELTMQANLQVQSGTPGTWNQRASDFLRQAHGMLPADGDSGPGYMFFATPEQRANVEMYAKHYANGTGMNRPGGQAIKDSMSREQAYRDAYAKGTIGAAAGAATIATGGPMVALPGTPIFSTGGILGSSAAASANGTGVISATINAGSQYVQNGDINPVDVAGAYVTGVAGASGGLVRNITVNALGGAITTTINNYLHGESNSVSASALSSGILASFGYGIGKAAENGANSVLKPGLNSSPWVATDTWSGSGWNLFRPNNTGVVSGTTLGGMGQDTLESVVFPRNSGKK
nr:hemagglutinin repeat-containing protein [Pandoraea terrigena]